MAEKEGQVKKVTDREFRRKVTLAYRRLQAAVLKACEPMICRDYDRKKAIAWRLVDDVRGELLDVIGALTAKKKGK